MASEVRRKLTTILAADAEGYSRAMEADEVRALGSLQAARSVFAKFIARHHGRIANTAGDGLIAEFPSVVEAVQCAIEVQRELGETGAGQDNPLRFRIGVHLGDVMIDGDDLLGEGVNLAARLQTMAEPGGILISQQVYDQVQKKLSVSFEYIGERKPKNFEEAITVYSVGSREASDEKSGGPRPREVKAAAAPVSRPTGEMRTRIFRRARILAVVWIMLLTIDLATGGPLWAHWPGLVMAALVGFWAAPLLARGWFNVAYVRIGVVIAALVLSNLFTWSGDAWAQWPAGALILIALIGRLFADPGKT